MGKTVIAPRQVFFLTLPLLLIMGHFFLVPIYLDWAGRDAWIGIMAGLAAGFSLFAAMGKLQERLYGKTLVEWALWRLGPVWGRAVTLPFIFYMLILSVTSLYGVSIFIGSVFFMSHPQWVITVTFVLVLLVMTHQGIEVIARVCEWVLLYNIVSGILVSLALHHKKEYSKLLPMLEHGWQPVWPVMLLVLAVLSEMIVLLMVHVRRSTPDSYSPLKMYMILFGACVIILPSTTTGPVVIFGEEQARQLTFPVESTVRLISVGFIERFDIYGLTIMTVSTLLRLSLLHYAASVGCAQWLSVKNYRHINVPLGAAVTWASLKVFDNYAELLHFFRTYYPYGVAAGGIILLLWARLGLLAKGRGNLQTDNS